MCFTRWPQTAEQMQDFGLADNLLLLQQIRQEEELTAAGALSCERIETFGAFKPTDRRLPVNDDNS